MHKRGLATLLATLTAALAAVPASAHRAATCPHTGTVNGVSVLIYCGPAKASVLFGGTHLAFRHSGFNGFMGMIMKMGMEHGWGKKTRYSIPLVAEAIAEKRALTLDGLFGSYPELVEELGRDARRLGRIPQSACLDPASGASASGHDG